MSNLNKELIKILPKGYAGTLAERCDVSTKTVYKVLHDNDMNHHVYREAVKLAEEYREEVKRMEQRIKNLTEYASGEN